MSGITVTAAEMQNKFDRYLALVEDGNEVVITKNGEEVARLVPVNTAVSSLTDSLTGILKEDVDLKKAREERLREKYEIGDG